MNKKELMRLLDKYEIEYEITDNTKEVEEGLRLLDEALEKIGIIIPKETQINNITRENDPEVPKYTTEWTNGSDLISRQAAIDIIEGYPHGDWNLETMNDMVNMVRQLPPVKVELKIYGNEHNCIMTMFGECSYSETGCGSCEVVEKVRDALKGECPPVEPERPKGTETMIVDGMEMEIDPVSYEVGYTHGQFSERPKGEWIGEGDGYADGGIVYDTWYCSECDHCEEGEELALPNFCPECGADMRGDKE